MKKLFLSIAAACTIAAVSCVDYKKQIEEVQEQIRTMEENLSALETITANLGALRNVFVVYGAGDFIEGVNKSGDSYDFTFKYNGTYKVENQTAGISVGSDDSGFFWTLDGKALTDASGAKASIAKSPEFRVSEGKLQMATDGKTWNDISLSTKPAVEKVEDGEEAISVTFLGGTVVDFPKEATLAVSLSGDGSTMAATGEAAVDFLITGKTGEYTVTPLLGEGWTAGVDWENSNKGVITFSAPEPTANGTARVFFCDGIGHMVAADIAFATLTVDETFPVMYPAWEAYNIAADGGAVDVSIFTNQDFEVAIEGGATWLSRIQPKAVREDVITFSAEKNESVEMRSALVTVTAGDYVQKFVIWQDGAQVPEGEDLSANGTANCYIVSREGDYQFNATVMGNGPAGLIAGADFPTETTELFPESVVVYYNSPEVINNVTLDKTTGTVHFHATGAKGSACISIKNGRNVVTWTWHIWCTDIPKDRTHTNPDQLQFTVLDRNLGATSADPADGEATYGLYYQWGRKDPFDLTSATSGMTANSSHAFAFAIRYPQRCYTQDGNTEGNWYTGLNNFFWGNPDYGKNRYLKDLVKTIYDPCPVGYMVPPANTFLIFEDASRTEVTDAGLIVHGDYGQLDFYPYAGRLYKNMNTRGQEVAFWHSCAARWNTKEDGGGAESIFEKATGKALWYQGDIRARVLPIRCVKQVSE